MLNKNNSVPIVLNSFKQVAVLVFTIILLSACTGNDDSSISNDPELQLYRDGRAAYALADYSLAITRFDAQLSQFPTGAYADDAHLYKGRAYYWLKDYVSALAEFNAILANFQGGNQIDSAQYWKAKVFHAQNNFALARTEYGLVDPAGINADNAAFHIGRTYFDEAELTIDPAVAFGLLDTAIQNLEAMALTYSGSVNAIDASYYIGRSYHAQARLLQVDLNSGAGLIPPTIPPTLPATLFVSARTAYSQTSNVSTYEDNAWYYLGRSYYDQIPGLLLPGEVYQAYQSAVAVWNEFLPGARLAASTYAHAALYFRGRSRHEQSLLLTTDPTLDSAVTAAAYLTESISSYEQSVLANPFGIYADNAQYRIGRAYFDQAQVQTVNADIMQSYQAVVTALDGFRQNGPYAASTYTHYALYYLGRSLHEQGLLLQVDATLISPQSAAQLFDLARTAYQNTVSVDAVGIYADNAQYYIGKAYYDQAEVDTVNLNRMQGYELALGQWQVFAVGGVNAGSSYAHSALYFSGRSRHQQAQLLQVDATLSTISATQGFTDARTFYQSAIAVNSQGVYADNAQYQIGATHYDAAELAQSLAEAAIIAGDQASVIQGHYTVVQQSLNAAINEFDVVTTDYQGSNSEDNAVFYLGRSYHRVARIAASYRLDLSGNVAGINFIPVDYAVARTYYSLLTTDPGFALSSLIDNAYYYLGDSYYDQAPNGAAVADQVAAYNLALVNYHQVVTNYPGSIQLDNSVYHMGLVYHDTGYCADEQLWLNYLTGLPLAALNLVTESDIHLSDLVLALQSPTAMHSCGATAFPGVSTGLVVP